VTPTEVALASALHEVFHLVATDFDDRRPIPPEWQPQAHQEVLQEEEPEHPTADLLVFDDDEDDEPDVIDQLFAGELDDTPAEPEKLVTVLDALNAVAGPAAEAMFLALEDARQEATFFGEYHGAWSVLRDLYLASVPEAMAQSRPLGQFALSCFLMAAGYLDRDTLQRRVEPHVAMALDDAVGFIDQLADTDDPWDVGSLALQLLQVAKLHHVVEEAGVAETKTQSKARMDDERNQIAETVDAVRIISPILKDHESYDETRQAAQTVSAQEGRKDAADQAGDPATDQIVKISESPTVYLPTGQTGKLVVARFPDRFREFAPDGHLLLRDAGREWGLAQQRVSGELYPLFLANQRRGLRSGYDAGDLSPYAALLLGAGLYERMFERRDLPIRRSYGVSLLIDGSASMLQPRDVRSGRRSPWALAAATLGAWTLARLCDELQIEFEVALFNRAFSANPDDTERAFSERRGRATGALRQSQGGAAERLTRTVNHYVLKSFDDRWRRAEDIVAGLFWMASAPQKAAAAARRGPMDAPPISMFDKAANVDEFNVAHAAERMLGRKVGTRILVVLADGMTRGSVQALAETVDDVERGGTVVLGIGIGDDTVRAAYTRNQVVERPAELAQAMIGGVRSALHQTIASMGGDTWWAHGSERVLYDAPPARSA
ncbi:MAG: hypothetical protein KJP12_06870, partial [Acidimicrobiia bacterium]|nr:hypothetical protein [Acidimicrobiia bacterium]